MLWEEVWVWCLFMLDVLIRQTNSVAFDTCLFSWGFWFPSGWDVYPRYVMGSPVWSCLISVWSPVLLEVIGRVYGELLSMVAVSSSWNFHKIIKMRTCRIPVFLQKNKGGVPNIGMLAEDIEELLIYIEVNFAGCRRRVGSRVNELCCTYFSFFFVVWVHCCETCCGLF